MGGGRETRGGGGQVKIGSNDVFRKMGEFWAKKNWTLSRTKDLFSPVCEVEGMRQRSLGYTAFNPHFTRQN